MKKRTLLKYRWVFAVLLFMLCLLFKIHGSSIGMYDYYFPTLSEQKEHDEFNIIGTDRGIRTDEWAVQVPAFFSQYYNDYDVTSNRMSVGEENMILDYFAPAKCIITLGKPLNWGYILFGNEIGLSWYWCGQLILLFMSAFEMFMILCRRNIWVSFTGGFMIALSPCVQWWFLPHMPIVFLYAMILFDIGYYFFVAKSRWMKWLMTVLAGPLVVGFAFSLFPSCQLTAAIIVIVMLVACLVRDKEYMAFSAKEWYRIVVPVAFVGVSGGYFCLNYMDDLIAEVSTVYPGKRISVGGDAGISDLFTNLSTVFLPYRDSNVQNNSEVSTYIQFAPFFLGLYPRIAIYYRKKGDRDIYVGRCMVIMLFVQILYMCIGFPEWLSKITQFKYVNRMETSYGWLAAIFTAWSIYAIWKYKGEMFEKWQKILFPMIFGMVYCLFINESLIGYISLKLILAEIVFFVIILIFVINYKKIVSVLLLIGLMFFAGATVNPVRSGISPITNHPISKFVQNTSKKDKNAAWITIDTKFYTTNFFMANGARVINATNFLPDFDKWSLLDKNKSYEESWNRYSHQTVSLADEDTYITTETNDAIHVYLNPTDLKALGVEYIVDSDNKNDITSILKKYSIDAKKEFEGDGVSIYKIQN